MVARTATIGHDTYHLRVNMPGEFNLQNAMAATLSSPTFGY